MVLVYWTYFKKTIHIEPLRPWVISEGEKHSTEMCLILTKLLMDEMESCS